LTGGTSEFGSFLKSDSQQSRIEIRANREKPQMFLRSLKKYRTLLWAITTLFVSTPVPLLLAEDLPKPACQIIERTCRVCMNDVCSNAGIACQPQRLVCPDEEARMKYEETIQQKLYDTVLQEKKKNEASKKDGTNSSEGQ
jgi:hypothetical protein